MALQTLRSPILWPNIGTVAGVRSLATSTTLDAAGEYAGLVFRATEAMTISHVWHLMGPTATGSPTVDIRIETVDATTGLPTGTLWATNTNIVTGALTANTEYTHALTASATIALGDVFAVIFVYNSGTSVVPFYHANGFTPVANMSLPYSVINTGTPTKAVISIARTFCVGSGATTFYRLDGLVPFNNVTTQAFSTSSGDAFGNRFKVPFKCRCVGLAPLRTSAAGGFSFGIYSDAGTELSSSSTSVDPDLMVNTNGAPGMFYFDNPVTLSPDTWYRAAIWPSSTTSVTIYKAVTSSDLEESAPYTNFHYTTKATGGSWTDTATTEALVIDILIDQLDDGVSASSGGGIRMAGHGGLAA